MTLTILYKMIKDEKDNLNHVKNMYLKFPGIVNPQAIEFEEKYIERLIKEYKGMGGKRNV